MAVINDIYEKVKHWNPEPTIAVYAEDHAEHLKCSLCGKEYISRGKFDPGICRDCEREKSANCVGGMFDGEPAHDRK